MILLAGIGAAALLQLASRWWAKAIVAILLAVGIGNLGCQAYMGTYRYYDDHANPYVYSHTSSDVFKIVSTIEELAEMHKDGKKMYIEVICPGGDYWPLPYYLRSFEKVGYFTEVDMTTMPAPVIISYASLEEQVVKKVTTVPPPGKRNTYVPMFDDYIELRPTIELSGFVMWDLLEGRLRAMPEPEETVE
jgi:hypothetical protein